MTALDLVFTHLLQIPPEKVYSLEAARIKQFGQSNIEDIIISGVMDYRSLAVEDFKKAYPLDISFNPLRLIKSFVKQIYELRIKEPLTMEGSGKDISH